MKPGIYKCNKDYHTPYPESILFIKGERVQIGEEFDEDPDWTGWIRCLAGDNREAWIPKSFLKIEGNEGFLLQDYDARELNASVGDLFKIIDIVNGFGQAENKDGERGWVPMNHLETNSENAA
jgi:hypothetical protein